tara:strand:- start:275 stop:460 length:186 start_codon:yes stop_codon:yes gene_type:complete
MSSTSGQLSISSSVAGTVVSTPSDQVYTIPEAADMFDGLFAGAVKKVAQKRRAFVYLSETL